VGRLLQADRLAPADLLLHLWCVAPALILLICALPPYITPFVFVCFFVCVLACVGRGGAHDKAQAACRWTCTSRSISILLLLYSRGLLLL
jgi:hypothetical protein